MSIVLLSSKDETVSLHSSIRLLVIIAQIFGFFPIQGFTEDSYKCLKFRWLSIRTFYSIIICVLTILLAFCQIRKVLTLDDSTYTIFEMSGVVFSICGMTSCLLFMKLAKDWPHLVEEWHKMEINMRTLGIRTNLKRKIMFLTSGFLIPAAVQAHNIITDIKCTKDLSAAFEHFFVFDSYSHVFALINYNLAIAILLQLLNLILTFSWTFVDVFIICMSTALNLRIQQMKYKVEITLKAKVQTLLVWKNLREDYERLCKLCCLVDEKLSYIIILSFLTNLFFILIQLFNALRPFNDKLEKVTFFYSFVFLIVRMVCVCLFGSSINSECKSILPILLSVPSKVYNIEVERLVQQISNDEIVLSGKHFFFVTKGLVLKIAGAIVTYELVIIQFNSKLLENNAISNNAEKPEPANPNADWLC